MFLYLLSDTISCLYLPPYLRFAFRQAVNTAKTAGGISASS
jgi:hypothetical protein